MSNDNKPIEIKASDEQIAGQYANMMQISHTKEEFVLDFVSLFPPTGRLVSRIVVSPAHAKRILKALEENVKRYESQFAKIDEADDSKPNFGFKTE